MLFLLPRNLVCYWSLHATIAPPWYFGLSGAPPRLEPPRGIAGSTGSTRRAKVPRKTCVVFVNWCDIMWYHRSEPFKCFSYVFGTKLLKSLISELHYIIWITYASYIIHWKEFHHFSRSSKYIQGSIPLNYLKWPRKHFTIPTFTAFICTCLPCISPQLQPVKVRFLASHSTKAAIKLNTTKAPFRRPWCDIFCAAAHVGTEDPNTPTQKLSGSSSCDMTSEISTWSVTDSPGLFCAGVFGCFRLSLKETGNEGGWSCSGIIPRKKYEKIL